MKEKTKERWEINIVINNVIDLWERGAVKEVSYVTWRRPREEIKLGGYVAIGNFETSGESGVLWLPAFNLMEWAVFSAHVLLCFTCVCYTRPLVYLLYFFYSIIILTKMCMAAKPPFDVLKCSIWVRLLMILGH
jgi:hypothetical protein